jgi:NADP-dependent aldehyde dehydrogenase
VSVGNEVFETALANKLSEAPRGYLLNPQITASLQQGLKRLNDHPHVEWLNEAGFEKDSMTPPNAVFKISALHFLVDSELSEEVFGPVILHVVCNDESQMLEVARNLAGNLTASIHAGEDPGLAIELSHVLEQKVGRVIFNGYPTGVEVCPSQQHGGPYPASSVSSSTSVGVGAIVRFARFVAYQSCPDHLLPAALQNDNPLGIYRQVNGELTTNSI